MKKFLVVLLILAMTFAFFGCGGSNSGNEGGSEESADVIKIGVVLPFSGGSQYVGQAQYLGYEYALKDFEEHYADQLGGAKIELVTGDSEGVPDTGVTELERLINEEDVSAIIGTYNSGVAAAMAPVAIKYGVPFMATNAVADSILSQESKYVYRTNLGDADTTGSYIDFLNYLKDNGAKLDNVAFVYEASDYGQGAHDNIATNILPEIGANVVLEETYTSNASDLSTIINKVKASGADVAILVMLDNDALLFTRQMKEYNLEIPIIAYGGGFIADNYIEQAGDASENIFASASYIYDPTAMSDEAIAIADEFVSTTEYTQMNEPFANGWLGMYSLLEAIGKTGGSADTEAIADALDSLVLTKGDRAMLFHPTLDGVEYDDYLGRYNQNKYAGMQFAQIQDGAYRIIFPQGEGTPAPIWNK